jgi:two-component system NtrC family sensor kinase
MKKQKRIINQKYTRPAKPSEAVNKSLLLRLEDFRKISHQIFHFANSGVFRDEFMRECSKILLDFSGCDEIELWVKEHNKYYHSIVANHPKTIQFGTIPIPKDEFNKTSADPNYLTLENLCHNIINGLPYSPSSFITQNGSFWTNDTSKTVPLNVKTDKKIQTYNLSNKQYKSLAIIPVKVSNEIVGLLQLKCQKSNYLNVARINFYEGITQIIGDALVTRHAQISLRERVKELSCLYGIALLVEKPNISLDEILQGIADLLPPAMLYPKIACAQIIFDTNYYTTSGFKNVKDKLSADIVINDEKRGIIEVGYSQKKVELDEGPFLKEERDLIDTVASEVVLIVERRKTAEDKERLQNQLRHADRLATIGQLAAGVAHELNEPLGNILGFAQLAKKSGQLPKQTDKDVDNIVIASLHAREVIKKLMFFARQMPPKKVQVNLNQLVEDGLYFLKSRCEKEGIEIIRSFSSNLPEITVDPSQLYQVFVNLAVNAIQAMPKGGKLTIGTFAGDGHITLAIEDTGVGINEEDMKQIFVPFFTTKGIGEGTGLGLSVSHGIVTAHGGTIKVMSKSGQGSRFEVKLPLNGAPDVVEEK